MSPIKACKEVGELASPWAVVSLVAYMIFAGPANGSGADIAVIKFQAVSQADAIRDIAVSVKELSEKFNPIASDIQSLRFRVDALEQVRGQP